ncbi:MAG: FKBP-type peptidyl-prolyl cis-trans isomerase [Desulfurella sp.]|uniref:Peptidyl-prolyl cis-trans isomerase n=1 Tax=Desulfurella multipotens TaxID=79269 RepID=A0A1G6ILM4_9BACT|nr:MULTISPECIES: peptidylprolyl isomerase [Desulfurella]AHF97538.1 peptidylprolyl isomerase [Desulfurella acetivorans A63]HEX12884.1 peptidylprolyl isomerase [Desulfurella acetivorans]PMP64922.1 MAG: peptidylprolyl isomerase [Desulfurella multipotens]PMP93454.1 MAG: peptidylprolyl isomerase [Desulfurella sp.]SDC07374.1 peptidylprolyl isomerase [Desulfurella multipotens]
MAIAQKGDKVLVHYVGKLDDGSVFDSSIESSPLEFIIGDGTIIPGFEEAVIGLEEGQKKSFTLKPEEAYGPYYNERVIVINKSQLPPDLDPQIGDRLQGQQPDGSVVLFSVIDKNEEELTLDGNHPLAGKNLNFEIELVKVEAAS